MADFTEMYLKKIVEKDEQLVQELTGIKNALGGGEGSALPTVTAADNGKVLTVVNGAWAAAEAGGDAS